MAASCDRSEASTCVCHDAAALEQSARIRMGAAARRARILGFKDMMFGRREGSACRFLLAFYLTFMDLLSLGAGSGGLSV